MNVWSIGELLWDIFPDQEQFGGAALNFSANLQRLGETVTLLSAVGRDPRGTLALERMRALALDTRFLRVVDFPPTGIALIGTTPHGEPSFSIPRPAAFDTLATDPAFTARIFHEAETSSIDWLYLGTLLQTEPATEAFTTRLAASLPRTRCFYDMNLRTGHWNLALVQRLSHLASILKLNEVEAETLYDLTRTTPAPYALAPFCASWADTYSIDVLCVTLGPAGCFVYDRATHTGYTIPGYKVTVQDTVGSGDAFAAAFLHGYQRNWPIPEIARFANALGATVASRAGATPAWTIAEVQSLAHSALPAPAPIPAS